MMIINDPLSINITLESSIVLLELSLMLLELSLMLPELSIMLLELSIMLLELSIMLLENIYSTGVTHDDCNSRSSYFYSREATGPNSLLQKIYSCNLEMCWIS